MYRSCARSIRWVVVNTNPYWAVWASGRAFGIGFNRFVVECTATGGDKMIRLYQFVMCERTQTTCTGHSATSF